MRLLREPGRDLAFIEPLSSELGVLAEATYPTCAPVRGFSSGCCGWLEVGVIRPEGGSGRSWQKRLEPWRKVAGRTCTYGHPVRTHGIMAGPNERMQLTKLRAAPVLQAEVPPCAPAGEMDGGTASQLIRSVGRT